MRLKPPRVPPAATAAFEAAQGPRVVPGTYTIKMTRGMETYTTQLVVQQDPRAKFAPEDRQMEFDSAMRVYNFLGDMSFAANRTNAMHDALLERAAKIKNDASLTQQLQQAADRMDELHKKIVSTKEGGAVTGEIRIREKTTELYGDILNYEGRPTDYQSARVDSLKKELADVSMQFDAFTLKELPAINKSLAQKKIEAIHPIARAAWDAASGDEGSGGAPAGGFNRWQWK
jgi:hypothetical protein